MNKQKRRHQILQEMASIKQMEKGRLTEEYRESFKNGKAERVGPYFKHQRWEDGRNLSRRVPADQAQQLRNAVEGYHQFEALANEYAEITIAMTREAADEHDSKKKPRS